MASPKRFHIDPVDTARGIAALGGIGLVGYGAWLHYPPLGFIAAGVMLVGIGVAAAFRKVPR